MTTPVYENLVSGTLAAALGGTGSGPFSDTSFSVVPDITSGTEHGWIVFDPGGSAPEIAKITQATSGSLTLTRAAGSNSSAATNWPTNTNWVFSPFLKEDITHLDSLYAPYSRIEQVVCTAGQTSVTFSSIPQNFDALEIHWTAVGASSQGALYLRFNSDTTAVYDHALALRQLTTGVGSTLTASEGDNKADFASVQDLGGRGTVRIPSYAVGGLTRESYFAENMSLKSTSAFGEARFYMGLRRSTDAITRIDIAPFFAGGFAVGSTFTLVGVGGTHP